jgi:hypothetical protein
MAQIKTANFLPEAYRTTTNQKFLNATLDQLVTQPDLRNINGYVGRTFAPTFKSTDNYVPEPSTLRQNYQLEPSVVVTDPVTSYVNFFCSYIDLLQQIESSGGITNNQTRLFSGESYSFDGVIDFDKIVNFNQYYWLENGPATVEIFADGVPFQETFTVTRDTTTGTYKFSTASGVENPTIRLAYGGSYQFIVDQPGYPFWIQMTGGVSGTQSANTTRTGRDVLGVSNNGTDVGTITFNVPQPTAQNFYVNMALAGTADLSTTLSYTQVQGQRLSAIVADGENGFDGVNAINQINLKSLIFVNTDLDDSKWTENTYGTIPVAQRRNAWQINLSSDADPIVTLKPLLQAFTISAQQKVFVSGGLTRAEYTYYLANDYLRLNLFNLMPDITAPLNTLFYQDTVISGMVGQISLLDSDNAVVDVVNDILGKTSYKSPNGVTLTNGLKVSFDSSATPVSYQEQTYYVEGVGESITLINVNEFVSPESYTGIGNPDYITINRASIDLNPWTRTNRWFHADIIRAAATYNNVTPIFEQSLRATRPIIEFEPNIQLFNFGSVAKSPVDLINFTVADSRNVVELQPAGYALDGVILTQGMRIVFANDFDPTVRDLIYVVNIVEIPSLNGQVINLVSASDSTISENNNIIIMNGPYQGIQYYYSGTSWVQGQQKTAINQRPLFDVVDSNGESISTYTDIYATGTTTPFAGTEIFSYSVGTGSNDTVLGFPLSYRTFNQIGDIQFTNNFDSDAVDYVDGAGTQHTNVNINQLGFLKQNSSLTASTIRNSWIENTESTKQFQTISGVYDGNNPYFQIDITQDTEATVPYFRVYKNAIQISGWETVTVGLLNYVKITDSALTTGDQIDIVIYSSSQVSNLGYYEVPKNLDYNSQNFQFDTLTLGQLRNHVSTMVANSNQVVGNFPGDSNLRDLQIKKQGGNILQHASPVLYSELFLVDKNANFLQALDLSRREYSKLKNKILESSTRSGNLDFTNIPALLDTLLQNINSAKNSTFSWYYSDMVPYGTSSRSTITYTVQSAEITDYEITSIFSDTTLGNTAILIYLNGLQLTKDQDYSFDTQRAGVTISAALTAGDTITIYEYSNTDANYIPETPTKLGLYPKFTPMKYYDTSYETPIYVIQGHDGSITPAFGDFRDDLLLEFEQRIYNNIKLDQTKLALDVYDYLPGKFRTTDYNFSEFTRLLTNSFLSWVGSNQIDYITNSYFQSSNPFSWCYNQFSDVINGAKLQGYWRGIYKYFYDTDRPHTNPWEMVGFSQQPAWWESRYGSAPYTGGNMVLWNDMAAGLIWNDGDSYVDERFVRPGLLSIIPVDFTGALVAPNQIVVKSLNSAQTSSNFKIGDQGPVETAWRRSSDYPFAFQQALALAKPAYYFGTLLNINDYYKNTTLNQFVQEDTLQRIQPSNITVNGTLTSTNTVTRGASYVNWVRDYLQNLGINPGTYIQSYLKNLNIQLAYKMASYTDESFIQVIAEQSSPNSTNAGVVIPNESYNIYFNKSTPVKQATYSAVVVERTSTGYTVSGYDRTAPYFTIIPSLVNGNVYQVPVLNDTAVIYQDFQQYKVTIPYGYEFSNRQQVVDFLVSYQRYLKGVGFTFADMDPDLNTQRDWILSVQEFLSWAQQGWGATSVLILSPVLDTISLFTQSGVVDKIQNSPSQSCILDTSYNFVKYSQMTVNRSSNVDGNVFSVTANSGQTIALARLSVVEYEHVMIFNNVDIFNDVIYVPELGNRQYRLKLVGKKTGSWTGDMNPPGFIFNNTTVDAWQQGNDYLMGAIVSYKSNNYTALKDIPAATTFDHSVWAQLTGQELQTGLLPNFSYNAEKFNRFNDIDNPEVLGDFHLYSDSAIGFQPRQYLTDFGLDEVTQAKFYQGYIRQKGTMNAINAFNAVGVNGATSNINVYEEWALRVGEYGALDNNRSVDLILTEGTFNGDPVTMSFLANGANVSANSIVGVYPTQLYKTQGTYNPSIYNNRDASSVYKDDLPDAGYAMPADVDTMIFDLTSGLPQLSANVNSLTIGSTLWTAKDGSSNWNIYRVNETDVAVTNVAYSIDNVAVVTTQQPHNRAIGDYIAILNFDDRVNGVYFVYNIIDAYNFSIVLQGVQSTQIQLAMNIAGNGAMYYLQSVRLKGSTDINSITPLHGWLDNDKIWVDRDFETEGWVVYNKSTPWTGNTSVFNANMSLGQGNYTANVGFGTVTSLSASGAFALASSPTYNNGYVYGFVANIANNDTFTLVANITQRSGGAYFGYSLDTAANLVYIGNPGASSTYGRVHIHAFDGNASFPWQQTLTSPSTSNVGDSYGTSVSASADSVWLYVSAPTVGNVYVYQANSTGYYTYANTISVGSSASARFGYTLKSTSTGNQVAIAAPQQTVNGISGAGSVYVFDRSIESFISNSTPIITANPIQSNSRIVVNGNVVTSGYVISGNLQMITFANVVNGSLITVETNNFQLLETLTSTNPTSGAAFGTSTWISGNDAEIFVSSPGYTTPGYYSGVVYRFANQGANYGTITGTTFNGNVSAGDSIRINGHTVVFSTGNVAVAAQSINSANIPGVTAIAQSYGALTITSNVQTPYQRLILGPSTGNSTANLGLNTFTNVQTLLHPSTQEVSEFGYKVMTSPDSGTLIVSARHGNAYNPMTFDSDTTFFDLGSTSMYDGVEGSGAVFVYGLVNGSFATTTPDQYVLISSLQNGTLSSNDQFGSAIAMNSDTMLIGAPGDSNSTTIDPVSGNVVYVQNGGTFYTYNNFSGNVGWDIVREQQPQVDIDSISRIYLYNANTQVISVNLDYIDPAKGKVLGAAQEDLDYITAYDPASYNCLGGLEGTPNLAGTATTFWGAEHKTQTWWNTGAVSYFDYEQGNVDYRTNNWGTTFPGSQIQVAEWVESKMPPSAYPGPGTALYPDNSAYSLVTTINPNTQLAQGTYYYWVVGKSSLDPDSVHKNTVSTIQDLIENPQAQNIPYAAVVQANTISLFGISNYLSGNSTILHLDYDVLKNTNTIHSEYQLVQEGNPNSQIPTRIVNKLIDSLSGIDANGFDVPDASLSPQTRLGLGVAPNQTLIANQSTALQNWVDYTNSILIQFPIVSERNITGLYKSDPLPSALTYDIQVSSYEQLTYIDTTTLINGYTVLVLSDETENNLWTTYAWNGSSWVLNSTQSYYTPTYWAFADWYDSTYDSTVLPTYVVSDTTVISTLTLTEGNTVKVLNNGNGEFAIYRTNSDGTNSIVGLQNGTIQLSSLIYTKAPSLEIRILLETFANSIWVDTYSQYFNSTFFFLINYILSEQPSIDWAFKTSFLGIIHYFKTLSQSPVYSPDDQTYYENYITEVQPYRTSIREYLLQYQGNDEYFGDSTDFDIPATYISSFGDYRSPNGSDARDSIWLSTLPQYAMWNNNHSYSIGSVNVTHTGANYSLTPSVTVVGGGGTGANIQAIVNFGTGQIESFEVIDAGYGFTSQPTIFVNGVGTGATGYANLVNHYEIDSLPTVTLTANSNVSVYAGNIISQANTNAYGTVYTASSGNVITLVDVFGSFNTKDYIFNDYANLTTNVTAISSYTQFINNSYNTVRNIFTGIKFDRVSYSSNVIAWQPNITITSNSIVSFDGSAYQATANVYSTAILTLTGNVTATVGAFVTQANTNANAQVISVNGNVVTVGNLTTNFVRRGGNILVSGVDTDTRPIAVSNVFDFTKYEKLSSDSFETAADRIMAYYDPTTGMPGKDLAQLMSGIEYPGSKIQGVSYSNTAASYTSVFNSNLIYTWSNTRSIYSSNVSIPTTTLNLDSTATVYTGNIIAQPESGAYGTVYATSTGNVVTLIDVVGSFVNRGADYLSGNTANLHTVVSSITYNANSTVTLTMSGTTSLGVGNVIVQAVTGATGNVIATTTASNVVTLNNVVGTFAQTSPLYLTRNSANIGVNVTASQSFSQPTTENLIDFTTFGYATGEPITVIDKDTQSQYLLNITEVDTWKIIVSGNLPITPLGANLSLAYYDFNNPTYLDSEIQNTYTSTPTSTISGGAYYDSYSSHAPEELVPGVTFDNLNMSVYTGMTGLGANVGFPNPPSGYTANVGYRIVQTMNGNAASQNTGLWPTYYGISASHNTVLTANLNITDSNIYVQNASVLTQPDVATVSPGVCYINGEKIIFWQTDLVNNVLSQIRRAADGTGAPTVHLVGSPVEDVSINELIPGGNVVNTTTWLNPPQGAPKTLIFHDSSSNQYTWVDLTGNTFQTLGSSANAVTDGTELEGSTTAQALFIKTLI